MSWQIDHSHSQITFSVRHLMVTNVRGEFDKFTGTVEFDEKNPASSKIEVQIEASSVNTKEAKRDEHLRSADFFDAEHFPYLQFVSKNIVVTDAQHGRIFGDLTIHGVTKEVVLEVEYTGSVKTPWGSTSAGFNANTKINRTEWGLNWNAALEAGGMLVGDEIKINLEVELVQVPENVPTTA